MGKRKYDSVAGAATKSAQQEELVKGNDSENMEQLADMADPENKSKKPRKLGGFDIKHFRKDLAAKQGQTMGKNNQCDSTFNTSF